MSIASLVHTGFIGTLVKPWLSTQFDMNDLGEASHILGIKLLCDCQKRMLGLSQATYIDHILARFSMQDFKKEFVPFRVEYLYQMISVLKLTLR